MASNRQKTPPGTDGSLSDGPEVKSTCPRTPSEAAPGAQDATNEPSRTTPPENAETNKKMATILILVSVFLSMFLVALDRTIVSTAIPAITDEFSSLGDVGWYGSAYLLTCCAFQLLFGKVCTFFPIKPVLLGSILLFEIASVICGAAPNSVAFIVGRAICGVGSAGIFAGTIVSIIYVVPLHQRPKIQGMFGALSGIASIVGPLLGGAFTTGVTWRWCFYINLPIGGIAMVVIALFLKVPESSDASKQLPLANKIVQLDLLGTAFLMPGVVCLLLALQWGGPTYPWNNARIIALLALAGVLLIAFGLVQALSKTATLPPRLVKQRNVISALWATLCISSAMYIFVYFLPIWFQAILSLSASSSGLRLLPLMLSMVAGAITSGILNSNIGYYAPLGILGSCIMSVGAGMLTTLSPADGSAPSKWIGYQVLYGLGLGLCFQVPNLAVQTALPRADNPIGLALMFFGGLIGSTVFVSVGQNVLSNQLAARLSGVAGFEAGMVTELGVTALLAALPEEGGARAMGRVAYNEALREVFRVGLVVSCLSVLGTATLEWLSVKKPPVHQQGAGGEEKGGKEEGKGEKGREVDKEQQ
ncbi:hypothetical protein VTI74DRAFT_8776 [Chaetomium olivicolor]